MDLNLSKFMGSIPKYVVYAACAVGVFMGASWINTKYINPAPPVGHWVPAPPAPAIADVPTKVVERRVVVYERAPAMEALKLDPMLVKGDDIIGAVKIAPSRNDQTVATFLNHTTGAVRSVVRVEPPKPFRLRFQPQVTADVLRGLVGPDQGKMVIRAGVQAKFLEIYGAVDVKARVEGDTHGNIYYGLRVEGDF